MRGKARTYVRIALATFVVGLAGMRSHQVWAARYRPFGHSSAAQISASSEAACRTFVAQAGSLYFRPVQTVLRSADGREDRCWMVDCVDAQGGLAAYVVWNADTGELISAVNPCRRRTGPAEPLRGREAARAAWLWLRGLGVTAQAHGWRLAEPAHRSRSTWFTHWTAPGRCAVVTVDARSGDLVALRSWRPTWRAAAVRRPARPSADRRA